MQRSLGRRKYGTYYLNRHWPNQILRLPVIGSLHLCNNVAVGIHRSKISVRFKKKNCNAVNDVLVDLELGNLKLDAEKTELVKDIISSV